MKQTQKEFLRLGLDSLSKCEYPEMWGEGKRYIGNNESDFEYMMFSTKKEARDHYKEEKEDEGMGETLKDFLKYTVRRLDKNEYRSEWKDGERYKATIRGEESIDDMLFYSKGEATTSFMERWEDRKTATKKRRENGVKMRKEQLNTKNIKEVYIIAVKAVDEDEPQVFAFNKMKDRTGFVGALVEKDPCIEYATSTITENQYQELLMEMSCARI